MHQKKVWAITGAANGLGPAATKFLRSKDQLVFHLPPDQVGPSLESIVRDYGLIDILIDNSAYSLIDLLPEADLSDLQSLADKQLQETMNTIRQILPFMQDAPFRHIITIPPKPCLLPPSGPALYGHRALTIQYYYGRLKTALTSLDARLSCLGAEGALDNV